MPSLIREAARLADNTPDSRNRVIDLLRATAICVVVLGHWLVAALYVDAAGEVHRADLLELASWTHPLTWAIQVMPIFFVVGGYANALSWRSARSKGTPYAAWLRTRLRRLLIPVVPLMLFWAVAAPVASAMGASTGLLRTATFAALVPTWFLAAYVVVVALVPVTLAAWERYGVATIAVALVVGGLVDAVSVSTDQVLVGFLNYAVVWAGVHQLGYAWLDGTLPRTWHRLALAGLGLVVLLLLVLPGPYSTSMVGVEGYGINNAYPTRVTMGFLGLLQGGLVMAAEPWLRALTARRRVWLVTILVNARIMTLYLWHLTALGIATAASVALGGAGLRLQPMTAEWWAFRPVWLLVLGTITAILIAVLGPLEQAGRDARPAPPVWRPVLALVLACAGLGLMADLGIVATDGRVHWYLPLIPVLALVVGGVLGAGRHRDSGAA